MHPYAAAAAVGLVLAPACKAVTVYNQTPMKIMTATPTSGSASASAFTPAAAQTFVLQVPPVPSNLAQVIGFALPSSPPMGASIQQHGDFLGFSIEMSVANQTLGKNSTNINVPFLNLISNLQQRGGGVNIRVGGNTQEQAELVDSLPNGIILSKDYTRTSGRTGTPPITYTMDLLYMMSNISTFVNVSWWLGVPFFDVTNLNLDIMVAGEAALGNRLLGFQVGNEPDLYFAHGHRNQGYSPDNYAGEFSVAVDAIKANSSISVKNTLIGPSVAGGPNNWSPEMVFDTGYVDRFSDSLKWVAVEHYPTDNCAAQFGGANPKVPQDELASFLTHQAGQSITAAYLNATAYTQTKGKGFLMFETNTASCGGFSGISNSFVAALWGLDYGLQLAYSNFTGANFHVGGQSTFYNPFTPPPTNQSKIHQWTVSGLYYGMLVVAEALGQTGTAQVVDLYPTSVAQPNYAIYENGKPTKLVLINYASDPSGASDYQFNWTITGQTVPQNVKVKYLLAPSVVARQNITWAGQTFGAMYESDGRPVGDLNVSTVACDQTANNCLIHVPAPAVALVFFDTTDKAIDDGSASDAPKTFATTTLHAKTNGHTATVDSAVLATSNGMSAKDRKGMGSTSRGGAKNGAGRAPAPVAAALVAVLAGAWAVFVQ